MFLLLKKFPRAIILIPPFFWSNLSLLYGCTILYYQRQRMLIVFKKIFFCSLYCLFSISIWCCLSWWRFISTIWWSFAVPSYLRVSHYKGIWKVYVRRKSLSVGGFHHRLIKWGPICFVGRPSSIIIYRYFFWGYPILSFSQN